MKTQYIISFQIILLVLLSCDSNKSNQPELDIEAYKAEVEEWYQKRLTELKGDNGWLNLAGLFWLKEGVNTFGSDESNDLVFPKGKIAAKAGFFLVKNRVVQLNGLPGVEVLDRGTPIKEKVIFHPDSTKNSLLSHGSLQWFIIKRDDQVGIRLRDLESKSIEEFTGIERYEVNAEWRVEATLEIPAEPRKIDITNVLGQTTAQTSPGTLVFKLKEKEYRLDALEGGKDELFIILGDVTNETETYPAGRYLYIKIPDGNGRTTIDFNKAYNPPCAFTPFATCPLPPAQNVLPIAIQAGEKNYHLDSH
jgi:uncharacterized protein (DUF1684 family)